MPQEMRVIVFEDHEVWAALKTLGAAKAVPRVQLFKVIKNEDGSGVSFLAVTRTDPNGPDKETTYTHETVRTAIVASLLHRKVRLPADAAKEIHLIANRVALIIKLNDQRGKSAA